MPTPRPAVSTWERTPVGGRVGGTEGLTLDKDNLWEDLGAPSRNVRPACAVCPQSLTHRVGVPAEAGTNRWPHSAT